MVLLCDVPIKIGVKGCGTVTASELIVSRADPLPTQGKGKGLVTLA